MKVSQIIYVLIRDTFTSAAVYMDHIAQDVNLQSTTGIILIKDISSESEGSKDLTSATRPYESLYRIEIIGHKNACMTLESLADDVQDAMIGYSDTIISVLDIERAYNDGNDVAEVKRFIRDFRIHHIKT